MNSGQRSPDVMDSSEFTLSSATEPDLSDIITSPDFSAKKLTKHLLQRKHMAHEMQILKIELNQKSMVLENLKAEYETKQEDMQEKINDLAHQKSLLQKKLESEVQMHRTESKRRQDNTKREFEAALLKQMQLEETNNRLIHKTAELKRQLNLDSLHLSEEEYEELRGRSEREISVHDFVAMRFFEVIQPVERELIDFRRRLTEIEEEKRQITEERTYLAEGYARERELHHTLQEEYQKTLVTLSDTKALVQHGNYKIENFDQIRDDRDRYVTDYNDLQERHAHLEVAHENVSRERDELLREKASDKQTISLLTQDKDYLSKQSNDLSVRNAHAEDRIQQLTKQLDDVKEARETLYEKYVRSRDEYKSQYEGRLHDELEQLRIRTDTELERLKINTKDMYERENRSLKDQRDEAFLERDRADGRFKEITAKFENLQRDLSSVQSCADTRVAELLGDVKLKAFELERSNLMVEELRVKLRELELNYEKVQVKLETVTKEYYCLESESGQKLAELETRLDEQKAKLDSYEAVENELDNVVMEAAEKCEDEDVNLERVTFAFADGAHLPSTARRRMQQSVHLARRVLALERKIRELNSELEVSRNEKQQALEESERAHGMLNDVQQPYGYLVDSLRLRDEQLTKQRDHMASLQAECQNLKRERTDLLRVKNQMSVDLEKLLSQREELSMLRRLMADLKEQRNARAPKGDMSGRQRRYEGVINTSPKGDETHQPEIIFSKKISPDEGGADWARVLKQRNIEPKSDTKKVYGTYYS